MKKTICHLDKEHRASLIHHFHQVKIAHTASEKLFGLINPKASRFLLLRTRFGIHTFFLKEPIDVIILNSKLQIINYKENLSPYRIFLWNPKYSLVLELPKDTIKKEKIHIGDTIKM